MVFEILHIYLKCKKLKYNIEQEVLVSMYHSQIILLERVKYLCYAMENFTSVLKFITREM